MRIKSATEDEKVARIRNRAGYVLFRRPYEFLNDEPSVPDILRKFHDVLDAKKSFGSRRNAECAAESLGWVLRDSGATDADYWPGEKHKKPCPFDYMGDEYGNYV